MRSSLYGVVARIQDERQSILSHASFQAGRMSIYAGTQLAYSSKARDQTNIKTIDNQTGEQREACGLFLESTILKARQSAGTWRFSLEHSLLRRYAITASN
jgi:hypothetical protein